MQNDILYYLAEIFSFAEGKPLVFTQLFFWFFFVFVLGIYAFVYKYNKLRIAFLLAVSFFFYFKTSGVFLLMLLLTIVFDYNWGRLIHKSTNNTHRKIFLAISVSYDLFVLAYFKYAYFFTDSFNTIFSTDVPFFNHFSHFSNSFFGTSFSVDKIILPVGISFFTFQTISYVVDIYKQKVQPVRSIVDYGFFVSFFPHLVSGPIIKANEFIHQIYEPYRLSRIEFGMAVFWIMNGLGKKIMADYIAVNFIDRIFNNAHLYSGVEIILGIFGYSLQIYADFSGYTDIAIGVALLLGFRLRTNFKSPYKATDVSEFWKRWHISLSSWLKEYLYIPLGGNKKGTIASYVIIFIMCAFMILLSGQYWLFLLMIGIAGVLFALSRTFVWIRQQINTNINLLVTMLLGGLWHGANLKFIIWGGLNGVALVIHKIWKKISPFSNTNHLAMKFFLMLVTLVFISFTRIWFRADSMATVDIIFDRIVNHLGIDLVLKVIDGYKLVFFVMLAGYLVHWIPETHKEKYRQAFAGLPLYIMAVAVVAMLLVIYQGVSAQMQPFIYFQF